ncbi:hypothetical protein [Pseudooctadecabacter jejudonensis]|uniref:DUF3299 domain-containing protein n=1 Tax=Pseudooctadecabacter jejudonensis TaxID=1391910 RepID=A0A1Y5T955_9RHOB|nr:hypothetical protein [Pseudooctadecabacter jejudonensis]SLN58507.1 hypothetical protein PSJ8397_03087 [Pseudooctadecabacter jejudonensis]
MKKTAVSALALSAPFGVASGVALADDANWEVLSQIEVEEIITETSYEVRKIFPAAIENGVEQFDITGYVVPLYSETDIKEFILISDMGFCPFCGDPEHGTSLQVTMADPLPEYIEGERITLRGALQTVTDSETWQTTILTNARAL